MSALFRCDGCQALLADDAPRIALEIVNVPAEVATEEMPEDAPEGLISMGVFEIKSFAFSGDHHFCSPSCLGGWAMDRAIAESESTP